MTAATLQQIIPAGTWNADPAHSQVDFAVKHMGISTVRGTFSDVSATLVGGEAPTLSGSIRVASVSTKDENRDAHLLSPDFFDAERYPEASFEATFVSPERVVGQLTLKGVTKEIELEASFTGPDTDPWGNERIGMELHGSIDRQDFGISWNTPLPGGGLLLEDEVKLLASLSFVKQA
ncbi:MAG TPA: YceI family protein [Gaiellaceae bacterium]|nr:YceI family protein [Gaiellaceae bacterium]